MPVEQLRSVQRHERILDAAVRVFSAKGYHGTLVDEIAFEAETSKGGVYFHFPNKQAIFLALVDKLAAMLRERILAEVARHDRPVARAEAALRVVLETFAGHRRLARLFMVETLGAGPEFNTHMIAIRASFADLIREQLDAAVAARRDPATGHGDHRHRLVRRRQRSGHALDAGRAARQPDGRLSDHSWAPAAGDPGAPAEPRLRVQADLLRDSGRMRQALERAERLGRPVLVSVTRPMPTHDPLLELERDRSTERLIWLTPGGESLVGLGAAYAIEARGPDRFAEAGDVWSTLLADAVIDDPASQAWTGPLALGGFSFDPLRPRTPLWSGFPDGRLVVPERMLVQRDGHAWLTTNCLVGSASEAAAPVELRSEPEPELDPEAWQALVRSTAMGMRQHDARARKGRTRAQHHDPRRDRIRHTGGPAPPVGRLSNVHGLRHPARLERLCGRDARAARRAQ